MREYASIAYSKLLSAMNLLLQFAIRLKHRTKEAIAYVLNYTRPIPSNQLRVVIFAESRTGSTLLESLLCSTGYFTQNGELLNTSKGEIRFPLTFVYGLLKSKPQNNFIFHVKITQLTKDRKHPVDPAFFLETLYKDGWKIIYLRRKNKVKHVLSTYFAKNRNLRYQLDIWHKFDDKPEKLNIYIDCEKFIEKVKKRIDRDVREKKALANVQYHEVIYEDDLERSELHQKTVNRILNYLSLEHKQVSTNLKKVNNQSLEELISNYEEFVECLKKSGWSKFLE